MSEERPFDAGSVSDVGKARRAAKRSATETENTIRKMLASREARALVWDYLGTCGLFRSTYSAESGAMYFTAGERNAGLRLFAMIPEDLKAVMSAEAQETTRA